MSTIDLLKKHGFKFNKKYGQNFIFDSNLLKSIVSDASVTREDEVLEIGCGAGSLTKQLSLSAKKVVAYEIDENLIPVLNDNLAGCDNVEIVFKDVLKASIEEIESKFSGDYILVANLPYYITTPIIFKFLEEATRLKRLVIMVQKEVAERLCANENTKDYGAITVSINYRADAKITRIVKRNMFVPAPNVDSAIVRIDYNKEKFEIDNQKVLDNLIKNAFLMRRKTLANNLKNGFGFSRDQISKIPLSAGLDENVRGESLSVQKFVELSNIISKNLK